ncbi:DUF6602 domain-containing protein [Pseudochelatococcus sp. G4_1912]|uniref:DUF6602 domain-containing protein n=1 Tax=Pseudochelatococcus sp. G4_1912 TaxID=3114288 RepID=UPI0039C62E30
MATNQTKKRRLTAQEKQARADFAAREESTRRFFADHTKRAIKLRSKDKEFHGLEREFIIYQEKMWRDYEASKDIKHPRDVGTAREVILRDLFISNKLFPRRYEISNASVRVASSSGHLSNELDILFYDFLNSITLMQRQGGYEVLPVESCYGVIQVKSKLTKKELINGLDNIASFKRLRRNNNSHGIIERGDIEVQKKGFGILFAYDTDLDWSEIVFELEVYAKNCLRTNLCNAVFILSKGYFMFGGENQAGIFNSHLEKHKEIKIFGFPDRQGLCLYALYDMIFNLLAVTQVSEVLPSNYFRLPLTAGEHSYEYLLGSFAEFIHCKEHGDFARKFSSEKLEKVIDWCKKAEPINWIKAIDLAYGESGDNFEAYEKQPGNVRIYNPHALPLSKILVADNEITLGDEKIKSKTLAYDDISSSGMRIFIPYYYQVLEELLTGCPKCKNKG